MKLKLGQIVRMNPAGEPVFVNGFRRLRTLVLPARQAYSLALVAGIVDTQFSAFRAARDAAIRKHGRETPDRSGWHIPASDADALKNFEAEIQPLLDQDLELPVPEKIKLPPESAFTADEILALVEAGLVDCP